MPVSISAPARARRDIYRESTEAVLATLERGTIPWRQPWSAQQGIPPRNAASGRPYRGVNFLHLALAGYESPWWLTFKQAKDRGARVRRGAHGMTIVKWTHARRRVSDEQAARARAGGQRVERDEHGPYVLQIAVRHYVVFNAEQIDGVEDLAPEPRAPSWQPEAAAAAIAAGYEHGPIIAEAGSRALYQPSTDHVQTPNRGRFASASDWHATLFHELAHFTGHRSRLDRRELYAGSTSTPTSPPS